MTADHTVAMDLPAQTYRCLLSDGHVVDVALVRIPGPQDINGVALEAADQLWPSTAAPRRSVVGCAILNPEPAQ